MRHPRRGSRVTPLAPDGRTAQPAGARRPKPASREKSFAVTCGGVPLSFHGTRLSRSVIAPRDETVISGPESSAR
jgi:hypothetical protein